MIGGPVPRLGEELDRLAPKSGRRGGLIMIPKAAALYR